MLDDLAEAIESIRERIATYGPTIRENETRTRMALIDPLLIALGWDTSDPSSVLPEYGLSGPRADYALLSPNGNPLVLLEAKKLGEPLQSHQVQMVSYATISGISYAGLTDGDHWEVYDVFQQRPLIDKRFIQASISNTPIPQCALMLSHLRSNTLMTQQPIEVHAPPATYETTESPNIKGPNEPIDPQLIIGSVAEYYDLDIEALVARTRRKSVSNPRQVAMYLLARELKLPPTHVGRLLGGRDHSTVIHGVNQVNYRMNEDSNLFGEVVEILEMATERNTNPLQPVRS